MDIKGAVKKFIGKVKENYGYFKAGRKAEFMEEKRRNAERNIRYIKQNVGGEMSENMEREYEELKKKGVY